MLKQFLNKLGFIIFPNRCIACRCVVRSDEIFCDDCGKTLSRIETKVCKLCGRGKEECSCRSRSTFFKELAAPFYYEGAIKKALWNLKFCDNKEVARHLGNYMTECIRERYKDVYFDCICCVPLHKRSLKKRGYNQSELIAAQIAETLGIELKADLLEKIYDTSSQHKLSWILRKGNLAGVFDVTCPEFVKDKTILLCDDISTSGQTFEECAKMLYLYGAKETYCVATALTKPKKKEGKDES